METNTTVVDKIGGINDNLLTGPDPGRPNSSNENANPTDSIRMSGDVVKRRVDDGADETPDPRQENAQGEASCGEVVRAAPILLYIGHFLSSWGDRMWSFAVAIFLIGLDNASLRLPAIYGLSVGSSSLVFGALVGDWVDKTPRMRAVVFALVVQNLAVAACAGMVMATLTLDAELRHVYGCREAILALVGEIAIIIVACLADLGSTAMKIAIQKDWIVVISGSTDNLARINSVTRAIDLTAKILAPVLTGVVMSSAGHFVGAAFIAVWNAASLGIEYVILRKVYRDNPALKFKESKTPAVSPEEDTDKPFIDGAGVKTPPIPGNGKDPSAASKTFLGRCRRLFDGWAIFMRHSVRNAGLGLAFLYMTVLGFDSITIGYAYTQGLCDSILGILQASGAIIGIMGTLSYPWLRGHCGLERGGLLASALQISCLSLCVAAVFLPGSPFVFLHWGEDGVVEDTLELAQENVTANVTLSSTISYTSAPSILTPKLPGAHCVSNPEGSFISVGVMMAGIIAARFGLWNLDLTITQILQEFVLEKERGIVNGVQHSLCNLFDMVKFVLVIFVPDPRHFGYLVILSFIFVTAGGGLYASYTRNPRISEKEEKRVGGRLDKQIENGVSLRSIQEGQPDAADGADEGAKTAANGSLNV